MAAFFLDSAEQRDSVPEAFAGRSLYQSPGSSVSVNMSFLNSSSVPISDAAAVAMRNQNLPLLQNSFPSASDSASHHLGDFAALAHLTGRQNVSGMHHGLSLSLGTQIPVPFYLSRPVNSDAVFLGPHQSPASRDTGHTQSHAASAIQSSKYLRAAQELLDEAVNVRDALMSRTDNGRDHDSLSKLGDKAPDVREPSAVSCAELSHSDRQDLQNKVSKLLTMLDEVDRRYKEYSHQMQIVASSFNAVAGWCAAKPYTALALRTISRHFRCLRDAISNQIQLARRTLGEQDSWSKSGGMSRLRYLDQHIRQQRAMQQFGMPPQNAWRPQRGLPESSVSILRAWLFEHFLHPYPKDSEKLALARQTGLTRSQVSNWFINARVRLWKPMIEEIYKEEFGAAELHDSNSSSENLPKARDDDALRSSEEYHENPRSPSGERNQRSHQYSSFSQPDTAGAALDNLVNCQQNRQRNAENRHSLLQDALSLPVGGRRFIGNPILELEQYENNNDVSLTLGLHRKDEAGMFVLQGRDIYRTSGSVGIAATVTTAATTAAEYDYMSNLEGHQKFSSSHLLHDYVA